MFHFSVSYFQTYAVGTLRIFVSSIYAPAVIIYTAIVECKMCGCQQRVDTLFFTKKNNEYSDCRPKGALHFFGFFGGMWEAPVKSAPNTISNGSD